MLDLLALVILLSIALGVSLHDAFWGIVAFSIGVTILFILIIVLYICGIQLQISLYKAFTPQARATRAAKRKKELKNDAFSALVFLWLASPLLIGVLLALLANDFTLQHPILTFLIATAPFVAGCSAFLMMSPKANKKRAQ